jgi:hypothetical protein
MSAIRLTKQRPARRYRCPASQRNRVLLERAADPLHRAGVNSELFGNDADTGPSRSRQSLTDSFFECGGDWRTSEALTLAPGPRKASTDSFLNHGRSSVCYAIIRGDEKNRACTFVDFMVRGRRDR